MFTKNTMFGLIFTYAFSSGPGLRIIGPLLYLWRVCSALRKSPRPDVYYSRYAYLLLLASFRDTDCIYEAHTYPSNPIARLAEYLLFRRKAFKHLVVISDGLKGDYRRTYPNEKALRIVTAHDGADLPESVVHPSNQQSHAHDGTPQIGYVGHLYPGKGMEMIAQLAPQFPHLTFHVVGGRDENLAYWKSRLTFPNVIFHGYVDHSRIDRYFDRFDIALAPLKTRVALEGGKGNIARWTSPLKIFEYMAHGKAIISSDLPVLREVLENNVTALMVPPDDVAAWCHALDRLLKDRMLRQTLGAAALKRLTNAYTWRIRARRVLG
jgi:glycosyltransferase involved in cell wall biosynthesis